MYKASKDLKLESQLTIFVYSGSVNAPYVRKTRSQVSMVKQDEARKPEDRSQCFSKMKQEDQKPGLNAYAR